MRLFDPFDIGKSLFRPHKGRNVIAVRRMLDRAFDAGLRIPEDVAVASFGGEMPVAIDLVGLTSAVHDWSRFVTEAVGALVNRLLRPNASPVLATIPTELTIQGSCGAPSAEWVTSPAGAADVHHGPFWQSPRAALTLRSDDFRRHPSNAPQ